VPADQRAHDVYEGLPPYITFSAPSGFLGRQVAHAVAADMQLPVNLKDWSDDHRIAYLFHGAGSIWRAILSTGRHRFQREMDFRLCRADTRSRKARPLRCHGEPAQRPLHTAPVLVASSPSSLVSPRTVDM